MYNLIIIEDEDFAREALCEIVDWEDFNMELKGAFADGSEAIEYIKCHNVDLIITDIKMEEVSGISVAKYVDENSLGIQVVLMSGYKNFEYAQQGIKYKVFGYITKPINYCELLEVLKNIKEKLDNKQHQDKETLSLLRRQFFLDLVVDGFENEKQISSKLNELNLKFNLKKSPCACVSINISGLQKSKNWKYGKDGFYNAINNIIRDYCGNLYFCFISINLLNIELVVIGNEMEKELFKKETIHSINNIMKDMDKLLDVMMDFKLGKINENIIGLSKYYLKTDFVNKNIIDEEIIRYIISSINMKNENQAISVINSIVDNYINNKMFKFEIVRFLETLTELLDSSLKKFAVEAKQAILEQIDSTKTKLILDNMIKKLYDNNLYSEKDLINKAIDYINENYANDISLETVADYVALSPAYFSRYFKKHTQDKFIDFVTSLRIEKSKKLISLSQYKIYEISQMVGYKNMQQFYKIFKLYTGVTPNEYRIMSQKEPLKTNE